MHLLNVHTRKLERFGDSNVPLYAILSHTWEDVEISHQDIQSPDVDRRPEYEKVKKTCKLAAAHGLNYVWIDTCCIDKTSSAELSEAINSMFSWYRDAAICYACLSDVELDDPDPSQLRDWNSDFCRSRWFGRGWTLQELIAPRIVVFLNKSWRQIGTKATLKEAISSITRIPVDVLLGRDLQDSSVAQKMSWASGRETSRVEDRAYSLLGIFGVNMPLLYGEGQRSFRRLQEQIISATDDYSIFAWKSSEGGASGLLARTPDVFYNSHDVVLDTSSPPSDEPIVFNSKGIHLSVQLLESSDSHAIDFAILPCKLLQANGRLAIHLQRIADSKYQFERVSTQRFELINAEESGRIRPKRVCIKVGADAQKKWRPMSEAAAHGNSLLVGYMLEQGVDPNESEYNGQSSLASAAINRHGATVELLLKYSPRANSTLFSSETLLALAFMTGHKAIARLFLGESVISTPLALSFDHGVEKVTDMLLNCGARVVHTAHELIIKTAAKDTRNAMRILFTHGGDPIAYRSFHPDTHTEVSRFLGQGGMDAGDSYFWPAQPRRGQGLRERNVGFVCLISEDGADLESKDSEDMTALTWAAAQGYEAICRGLIDSGADLESVDELGATPLAWAATNHHEIIVKLLLERGAKVDCADAPETTPLGWACGQGNETIVDLLLSGGADPDRKGKDDNTALHLAVRGGHDTVVKLLLENGASCDLMEGDGRTALHLAIHQGQETIAKTLLKAGSSPNSESKHAIMHSRPLGTAIWNGNTKLAQLLLEAGADPDYQNQMGMTPLMSAAIRGYEGILKLLLDHGADSTLRDSDGRTALDICMLGTRILRREDWDTTKNRTVMALLRADEARRQKKRKRSEDENYERTTDGFREQS